MSEEADVELLSGCAGRIPGLTAQADCERNGGMRHTNLGLCETSKEAIA